ncbi:uncharacterized protein JN550_011249 [Neoarthrinium moseri]|uniref:uncharacterized protein n=1 Tax=Neoarthrinium moseri TaxID=1658444 RepID=UPI001FDE7C22|nr:uncharacterized protein JN550_011249 [Neoarthrinium moseri]KAI1860787.1 hypothetical protein JN550_011249 [Neoarthrinium moseri]
MDPQQSSRLFALPWELRRAIYRDLMSDIDGAHISFNPRSGLFWSPCLGANDDSMRQSSRPIYHNGPLEDFSSAWVERMSSDWGCHWQCEEEARSSADLCGESRCCSRMHYEYVTVMMEHGSIHVTDLAVLEHLVGSPVSRVPAGTPSMGRQQDIIGSNDLFFGLRTLDISLRLNLAFFVALDASAPDDRAVDVTGRPESETETVGAARVRLVSHLAIWKRLPQVLGSFPLLIQTDIRLDHDDVLPWALINEHAVFKEFGQPNSCYQTQVDVTLPLLLPSGLADPTRHLMVGVMENIGPGFRIHRQRRFPYVVAKNATGWDMIRTCYDREFSHANSLDEYLDELRLYGTPLQDPDELHPEISFGPHLLDELLTWRPPAEGNEEIVYEDLPS